MGRMRLLKTCLMALACLCLLLGTGWAAEETRTVVDGRGVEVHVPAEIERVVTVSDGLVESVMYVLGEDEKIVGVGSSCLQQFINWSIPVGSTETYEYRGGMNLMTYLSPRFRGDLPLIRESGAGINYETLAGLDPDLVILRVGDCTLRTMEDEGVQKTIQTIENLGIPVIVLKAHPCFDEPDLSTISDEIRILGNVFGNAERAGELADFLESQTRVIVERTKDIPDSERPTVLIFGAPGTSQQAGGAGNVRGTDTIESYFVEEIVHAKNAYQNTGQPTISAEQLIALEPDVIVLCTWNGYHPPEELYYAPYFQNVGELSAIKNRRVISLPFIPCNCARRLEYPIELMVIAKAAYPERFADIELSEWVLEFYQKVYGVDLATAKGLLSSQLMDWCVEGWTPTRGSNSGGEASYQRAP